MPRFSSFTPFGCLAFSGRPSRFQEYYEQLSKLLAPYDLTPGTTEEADVFATARVLAYVRLVEERVANGQNPMRCSPEFLPGLEEDYGERPLSTATIQERRERLAYLERLVQGFKEAAITTALSRELGDDFLAIRQITHDERTVFGGTSLGLFARPEVPMRRFAAAEPLFPSGSGRDIAYENFDATEAASYLVAGEYVVVEPEDPANAELVAVVVSALGSQSARLATTKTHPEGCSIVAGHCPLWMSTRQTTFIVLKADAAIDPTKRAKAHDVMKRISPASNRWAVVASTDEDAKTIGPFTIGTSPLDATPLSELTYV